METLLKKKTILVVENDQDMNEMVCDALDEAGYLTISAFSGEQGLRLMLEELPDMVLLDIRLPDKNGIDICRTCNQDEMTKSIPIIMLTGCTDLSTKLASFIAGARRYITKPFLIESLLTEVERALRQHEMNGSVA